MDPRNFWHSFHSFRAPRNAANIWLCKQGVEWSGGTRLPLHCFDPYRTKNESGGEHGATKGLLVLSYLVLGLNWGTQKGMNRRGNGIVNHQLQLEITRWARRTSPPHSSQQASAQRSIDCDCCWWRSLTHFERPLRFSVASAYCSFIAARGPSVHRARMTCASSRSHSGNRQVRANLMAR